MIIILIQLYKSTIFIFLNGKDVIYHKIFFKILSTNIGKCLYDDWMETCKNEEKASAMKETNYYSLYAKQIEGRIQHVCEDKCYKYK